MKVVVILAPSHWLRSRREKKKKIMDTLQMAGFFFSSSSNYVCSCSSRVHAVVFKMSKNLRRAQLECSSACALTAPQSKWCIVFGAKDFGSEYRQKNKPGNAAGWRHRHVCHRFRTRCVPDVTIFHCFGVLGGFFYIFPGVPTSQTVIRLARGQTTW